MFPTKVYSPSVPQPCSRLKRDFSVKVNQKIIYEHVEANKYCGVIVKFIFETFQVFTNWLYSVRYLVRCVK